MTIKRVDSNHQPYQRHFFDFYPRLPSFSLFSKILGLVTYNFFRVLLKCNGDYDK